MKQAVKDMDIKGPVRTAQIVATPRRTRPEQTPKCRALVVSKKDEGSPDSRRQGGFGPYRRTAAFLAQLALQYDGISAQRTRRAERTRTAIAGYESTTRVMAASRVRTTRTHQFA